MPTSASSFERAMAKALQSIKATSSCRPFGAPPNHVALVQSLFSYRERSQLCPAQ